MENRIDVIMDKIVPLIFGRSNCPEYPSGLTRLDDILWGFKRTETYIIAGRPSQGKTSLSLFLAWQLMMNSQKKVSFFSLEMGKEQIGERLLAMAVGVDNESMMKGSVSASDKYRIEEFISRIKQMELYIHDDIGFKWEDMEKHLKEQKPDIFFVDYVQMITPVGGKQEREVYGEYIKKAKTLAKTYNIPIVINSQINRSSQDHDPTEIPKMHQLKGAGTLEENPDGVIIVHWNWRNGALTKEGQDYPKNEYQIYVAKNRNGKTGTVTVNYIPEHYKFSDMKPSIWDGGQNGRQGND